MSLKWFLLTIVLVLFLGCTRDQIYRHFYESFTRDPVSSDGINAAGPSLQQPMTYNQYKYERERALKKDMEKPMPQ